MTLRPETVRSVPFLDLRVTDPLHKQELLDAVDRVLSHGRIVLGPEVDAFEERFAALAGRRHAVGVGSGSQALYLAMQALGIGPGDEVITSPLGWIAAVNAIVLCGAEPRFVDIGDDLNIDASSIESAVTPRTKVVLPIHWNGLMCDMRAIARLAEARGLHVIEDAAQAVGARLAGSFGRAGCFSMNPMKVLCAYGEAGAVVTDDDEIASKLRCLRYAGTVNREDCHYPALNARIDTMQAALLLVNLDRLPGRIARRREIADFYSRGLRGIVACPAPSDPEAHVYYTYTVVAEDRDRLMAYLQERGVETRVRQPILMPDHTAYRHRPRPQIPNADRLIGRIVSLPMREDLTREDLEHIVDCIREYYGASRR